MRTRPVKHPEPDADRRLSEGPHQELGVGHGRERQLRGSADPGRVTRPESSRPLDVHLAAGHVQVGPRCRGQSSTSAGDGSGDPERGRLDRRYRPAGRVRHRRPPAPSRRRARPPAPRPGRNPGAVPATSGRNHIWTKWTGSRGASGSIRYASLRSACTMPEPALIRCASRGKTTPELPAESEWCSEPESTQVTISESRCGWSSYPELSLDAVLVVHQQRAECDVARVVVRAEGEAVPGGRTGRRRDETVPGAADLDPRVLPISHARQPTTDDGRPERPATYPE